MRIPLSLQKVFLSAGCHGQESIEEPPSGNVACKIFAKNNTSKNNNPKWKHYFKRSQNNKANRKKIVQDSPSVSTACTNISEIVWNDVPRNILIDEPKVVNANEKRSIRSSISPQDHLDSLMKARGYSTKVENISKNGYRLKPSPLQIASHHSYLIKLAREGRKAEFKSIVESGISPQPCNKFGESLLHLVCRRCDFETLQILLNAGATVLFADDYGRNPLHDACWRAEPSFEMIEMIASENLHLFYMSDIRGSLPLSYVHADHWDQWIAFLESKKDIWWPETNNGGKACQIPAFADVIPDPENALNVKLATMVVAGILKPEEAITLRNANGDENMEDANESSSISIKVNEQNENEESSSYGDSDDCEIADDSESSYDEDYYSDDDTISSSVDEDDGDDDDYNNIMVEMMGRIAASNNI